MNQPETSPDQIEDPTTLLRIGSMISATLDEVRKTELDDAARETLVEAHRNTVDGLREVLGDDLRAELDQDVDLVSQLQESPTEDELRVAQARLLGWLEGVMRGLQASAMGQQLAGKLQAQGESEGGADPDQAGYL